MQKWWILKNQGCRTLELFHKFRVHSKIQDTRQGDMKQVPNLGSKGANVKKNYKIIISCHGDLAHGICAHFCYKATRSTVYLKREIHTHTVLYVNYNVTAVEKDTSDCSSLQMTYIYSALQSLQWTYNCMEYSNGKWYRNAPKKVNIQFSAQNWIIGGCHMNSAS